MKTLELKQLSKEELKHLLYQKQENLRAFYFTSVKAKIKNVKEAKNLKKDVAKILTFLNQYEKKNI